MPWRCPMRTSPRFWAATLRGCLRWIEMWDGFSNPSGGPGGAALPRSRTGWRTRPTWLCAILALLLPLSAHAQDAAMAAKVRAEFLHSWRAYEKYAWGHDELRP